MLASAILGTPVTATFAVRGFIVFGMVLGVLLAGGLFTTAGAAAGAAVAALTGEVHGRAHHGTRA
jgi:hypothetical protein